MAKTSDYCTTFLLLLFNNRILRGFCGFGFGFCFDFLAFFVLLGILLSRWKTLRFSPAKRSHSTKLWSRKCIEEPNMLLLGSLLKVCVWGAFSSVFLPFCHLEQDWWMNNSLAATWDAKNKDNRLREPGSLMIPWNLCASTSMPNSRLLLYEKKKKKLNSYFKSMILGVVIL